MAFNFQTIPGTGGYANSRIPFIKNDRFGNPYQVKKAYLNDAGFAKAHFEVGGKLYAVEFGTSSKGDEKTGRDFIWCRLTNKKKQNMQRSM